MQRMVLIIMTMTVWVASCGTNDRAAEVLATYVDAFNVRDADGMTAVFAEDAVVVGHPLDPTPDTPIQGIAAIGLQWREDVSNADGNDAFEVSNVEVSGDTVTFDHVFFGSAHTCAGAENQIVVREQKIVSYRFAEVIRCDDDAVGEEP